jgi:hypothetical protein
MFLTDSARAHTQTAFQQGASFDYVQQKHMIHTGECLNMDLLEGLLQRHPSNLQSRERVFRMAPRADLHSNFLQSSPSCLTIFLLFHCVLFNDAVRSSDYTPSDDWMMAVNDKWKGLGIKRP